MAPQRANVSSHLSHAMSRLRAAVRVLAPLNLMLLAAVLPAQTAPSAKPTVVLIAGLGDDARVWKKTIGTLGDSVRVVAYNRPGYAESPATDAPRDACTVATELHTYLHSASLSAPFVVVGHSIGGQYAYAYARLFPDDVAGLVLVDATPVGHWASMQKEMPMAARMLRVLKATTFSRTMKREFDAQEVCLDSLPTEPVAFPARVLVRTIGESVGGEQLLRIDTRLAASWLQMLGTTLLEPVARSGHYIQKEQPEYLASVIRSLLVRR